MYSLGDYVVYGSHGVCRMLELEERVVDRKKLQYYVLEPVTQIGARYLVPLHNDVAVGKLRPVLSREELDALICSTDVRGDAWIPDENLRKQTYRELMGSGDRAAMIRMIGTLYRHKEAQAAAGRKFHLCDDNFLRDAQKLLSSEFAHVLGIEPDAVGDYVQSLIGQEV